MEMEYSQSDLAGGHCHIQGHWGHQTDTQA
jgi:hypothetical protein